MRLSACPKNEILILQKRHADEKGMTLIELMVTMAIFSIIVALFVGARITGQNQQMSQQQSVDMTQTARAALMLMTREIRMAGYDPSGNLNARITAVGDSDTTDSAIKLIDFSYAFGTGQRNVSYALDDEGGDGDMDLKVDNGGGYHLMAENIQALTMDYLDEDGDEIALPAQPVPQATLDAIRAVQIEITVIPDNKELDRLDGNNTRSLTATVKCRNLGL